MISVKLINRPGAVISALASSCYFFGAKIVDAALVGSPDIVSLQQQMFRSNPTTEPQFFVIPAIISEEGNSPDDEDQPDPPPVIPLPPEIVGEIVMQLQDINIFCGRIPEIYRIDCLADQYAEISRSLPYGRSTGLLKRELFRASHELAKISQCRTKYSGSGEDCFVDASVQTIQPSAVIGSRTLESSRPLTPIKTQKLAAARTAATFVVEETMTVLLRSTESSSKRREQFARIVQAMDSNKVLLRS